MGYDRHVDHILVTAGLAGRTRIAHIDTEVIGPDHPPIWAEIDFGDPAAPLPG